MGNRMGWKVCRERNPSKICPNLHRLLQLERPVESESSGHQGQDANALRVWVVNTHLHHVDDMPEVRAEQVEAFFCRLALSSIFLATEASMPGWDQAEAICAWMDKAPGRCAAVIVAGVPFSQRNSKNNFRLRQTGAVRMRFIHVLPPQGT